MARDMGMRGVDDLLKFLKNFAPDVEKKMLDSSLRIAVNKHWKNSIKALISGKLKSQTGNLLKGVKVGKTKGAPPGTISVYMGPPAYHAHWFEFGTAIRPVVGKKRKPWTTKRMFSKQKHLPYRVVKSGLGRYISLFELGRIKRTPYFTPGVDNNKGKVMDELRDQLRTRIGTYVAGTVKK